MYKALIGGIATALLTAAGASAGDLPVPGPCGGRPCPPLYPPPPPLPPAPPPYLYWCGPYLGVNLGFQSGVLSDSTATPRGVLGGIQGGYSWQFGQWVAGWESDFQFTTADDKFSIFEFSNPWFGTVRGRGGIAFDNVLLYGTLGMAYGRGRIDAGSLSEVNTHIGWAVGAGVELGLSRNWSVKAEYLRVDLASEPYVLTGAEHGPSSNVFRVGVNFRF
jgi:outer membrane immunogenic protein